MSFIVVKTNNSITVYSDNVKFENANCTEEMYQEILATEGDLEKLTEIFHPKIKEAKKQREYYDNLLEDVQNSKYLVKGGDCIYIPEISEISVPEELVKAILSCEKEGKDVEPYLNFWRLASMNPNSNARANLFWFLKKWGMKISKSGFIVAYRNAILKDKPEITDFDEARFISDQFLLKKTVTKEDPSEFCIVRNRLTGELKCFRHDDEELEDTYTYYEGDYDDDDYDHDEDDEDFDNYYVEEDSLYEEVGDLVALYKDLGKDRDTTTFTDQYSKSTTIKIGKVVEMPREDCDESQNSCSRGLHVGALGWLKKGYFGDVSLMCLVNPAKVVSAPPYDDYGKIRCCEYYPVAIVDRDKEGNLLEPNFKDGFDDDFLDFKLTNYGINNNDVVRQSITLPEIPELGKMKMVHNLEQIKKILKKRVVD